MAQHDYVIDNGPGLAVRTDINAAFAAVQSTNSGAVEPAAKVPGQLWFNTTTGVLSMRNSGNTAWSPVSGLSADGLTLDLKSGTTLRGRLQASGGASAGIQMQPADTGGNLVSTFYVSPGGVIFSGYGGNIYMDHSGDRSLVFRNAAGVNANRIVSQSGTGYLYLFTGNAGADGPYLLLQNNGYMCWSGNRTIVNNAGSAGDVEVNHRVSATRAMRWYYESVSGNITLQETDDNFGTHFINVMQYARGTNIVTFGHYVSSPGYVVTPVAGSGNGMYTGTGDAASFATYNLMIRSWWGIGLVCATDNVCRIVFDTRSGGMSAGSIWLSGRVNLTGGAFVESNGNIAFGAAFAASIGGYNDLGGALLAGINTGGVYTGSDANNLTFPIGTTLLCYTGASINRNSVAAVYVSTAGAQISYDLRVLGGAYVQLAGSWAVRGAHANGVNMQRIA